MENKTLDQHQNFTTEASAGANFGTGERMHEGVYYFVPAEEEDYDN